MFLRHLSNNFVNHKILNYHFFRLLHNCIKKLGRVITPAHAGLRIPHRYLNEAPWPFAQQQISYISAYKTPQEKVQCVIK